MKKVLNLAVAALMAVSLSGCINTGDGEKIGMVTKLAKQGVIIKTWEGEIVRGGLSGGSGVNGQSFHFTIQDEAVAKQVLAMMENQQEVKITYTSEMFAFFTSESGGHFLTKIEPITHKKTTAGTSAPGRDNDKIIELLRVQAQLIEELAK